MTLERWIALLFLAGSAAYAYAAFTYPLLPFERNMSFLPNTWPKVLSIVMILLSAAILLQPAPARRRTTCSAPSISPGSRTTRWVRR